MLVENPEVFNADVAETGHCGSNCTLKTSGSVPWPCLQCNCSCQCTMHVAQDYLSYSKLIKTGTVHGFAFGKVLFTMKYFVILVD